jgi:hypothetical protein
MRQGAIAIVLVEIPTFVSQETVGGGRGR